MTTSVRTEVLRAALERAGQLVEVRDSLPESIADLTDDSRRVGTGTCFVAVRGSLRDGHAFLGDAAGAGASCAIIAEDGATALPALVVRDTRAAAAVAAAAFYGQPAEQLQLVAVTGTNGKTTTVGLLRHLLDSPEAPAASLGTLGVLLGDGTPFPGGSGLTTPGPIELHRLLRALVEAGVRRVAMEVSSHALDQQRVGGLRFDAAVFTNLTRDHLDYHGTMDAYLAAKARLIGLLSADGTAVVNADDDAWRALPKAPRVLRFGVGLSLVADSGSGGRSKNAGVDVRATEIRYTPRGSAWLLGVGGTTRPVVLPLIGDFNVSNALAAAAAATALGLSPEQVAARLATTPQVPGRLELLAEQPTVLRDYAHTPDALARALAALRPFAPGRLIVLFGCGGDRDRGKRPLMAEAARAGADHLVVTSDNPRTEDPERILDEIVAALPAGSYDRIEDRRAAIAHAIALADPARDVVLLAGKGHETYQIRGTTSHPFDEAQIVRELLARTTA
ncbi:MAG: UDP-N-acetylmuramoyl-L-alanyl-D-glutamate--2,6-diaminopimelate ligase [Gemmatimonadaceae bacterium]|nr:UDP-N-acetylmuramoyl-L-alanyl-D-glutamate--2,6-diaminopimelate ligase [Gemmatimonadaceae bacterium]